MAGEELEMLKPGKHGWGKVMGPSEEERVTSGEASVPRPSLVGSRTAQGAWVALGEAAGWKPWGENCVNGRKPWPRVPYQAGVSPLPHSSLPLTRVKWHTTSQAIGVGMRMARPSLC